MESKIPLQPARTAPLSDAKLRDHLGRFGETVFALDQFENGLGAGLILPIGELNRLRRELIFLLEAESPRREEPISVAELLPSHAPKPMPTPELAILCRTDDQLREALACGVETIYVDFEDIRRYKDAVATVREAGNAAIFLATPRIQKAGEQGFFKLIENAEPDGVLARNLGSLEYFRNTSLRKIGDFSLNIANPLTAEFFMARGLERVTISYDLNLGQVVALLKNAPPEWFELTIHQHMPMFHMEHCAFAAFLSKGKTFLDCGRPCETHRVHLRDRVGIEHPLRADVGCRNTLYNAVPQTGAQFFDELVHEGLRSYRVELLEEDAQETRTAIRAYQQLIRGEAAGGRLWQDLSAQSQLGVTRGTYREDALAG